MLCEGKCPMGTYWMDFVSYSFYFILRTGGSESHLLLQKKVFGVHHSAGVCLVEIGAWHPLFFEAAHGSMMDGLGPGGWVGTGPPPGQVSTFVTEVCMYLAWGLEMCMLRRGLRSYS